MGTNGIKMIELKDAEIDLPQDVIIKGNAKQFGFYRVNYDLKMWDKIIMKLRTDHKAFDERDRAGLLGDAFALAQAGRLSYKKALELFEYLKDEKEYLPWRAGVNAISYIPDVLTKTRPAQ